MKKMTNSQKVSIVILAIVVIAVLGKYATRYNERAHKRMAMEACGSEQNIKRVDSKGFECVVQKPTN